jgi:hypothetical protein
MEHRLMEHRRAASADGRAASAFGTRLRLQPGTDRIELGLQCLAPGDFSRQRLRVEILRIGDFRPGAVSAGMSTASLEHNSFARS